MSTSSVEILSKGRSTIQENVDYIRALIIIGFAITLDLAMIFRQGLQKSLAIKYHRQLARPSKASCDFFRCKFVSN